MSKPFMLVTAIVVVVVLAGTSPVMTNVGGLRNVPPGSAAAFLRGYDEVPIVSTTAQGTFVTSIDGAGTQLSFELAYSGISSTVLFAHIHLGQTSVNGGVAAFLCGGGSKPPCPASGTVTGTITPADVIGPAGQGVAAGEFAEVLRALRSGVTYANVHSSMFPGGEIRGQIVFNP